MRIAAHKPWRTSLARKRKGKGKQAQTALPMHSFTDASLADETQRRYLNYALSVITARALPDVRDGLKPVQRRILYTMFNELRLRSDARYRKSAAIVGDVMGKFHPHGDVAIYDALARMAQDFVMRMPLVDGRGNFGSPDGDSPAAMRYTEARLTQLADVLLEELGKKTVHFRPNYDGTRFEPVVLPAQFPAMLVNGSQGIAVGMATSIPPHNMGEVVRGAIAMIDEPNISLRQLLRSIKGPDFPTGGQLVSSKSDLVAAYENGQGSLKLRGEWTSENAGSHDLFVIQSIPYGVERRALVEKIAEVIIQRKMPALVDVRDESAEECRVVCEVKRGSDPQLIAAYLFKHTPLQTSVSVNLTCLVPTDSPDVAAPERLGLSAVLRHFLDFRMEVVEKRLAFDLQKLRDRIHILEGFVTIFDALDETIRIIRRSEGKSDAAQKIIKRFKLDEDQVDAILELKLYRLAKLQILVLREELEAKKKDARRIEKLLKSKAARWKLIRAELHELAEAYPSPRRTRVVTRLDEPQFDANAFIVDEDAMVVVTQQGWIKRQQRVKDVGTTRVREGDRVMAVVAGSTRSSLALFSSQGVCYVLRFVDIAATSGHGTPLQTLLKMKDGERVVSVMSFDPRFMEVPEPTEDAAEPEPPLALAVTRKGMCLRFSLTNHREPTSRSGRRFCRVGNNDEVVYVEWVEDGEVVACATRQGRALLCPAEDVSVLAGPGKGVMLIKLAPTDALVGAKLLVDDDSAFVVSRSSGTEYRITTRKYETVSRGGKGFALVKRGGIDRVVVELPTVPEFPDPEEH